MPPTRLPQVSGRDVIRALAKMGFSVSRVRGSHHMLRSPGPPVTGVTVPVHGNRPVSKGTLRGIIEEAGLTVEEFKALL